MKKNKKIEIRDTIILLVVIISFIILTVVSNLDRKKETTIEEINPLEVIF